MQLSELGERICIWGPSNSGKSTLADAIARRRGLRGIYILNAHVVRKWAMSKANKTSFLIGVAIALIGIGQNMSGIGGPLFGIVLVIFGLEIVLGCLLNVPLITRNLPWMFRMLAFVIVSCIGLALGVPAIDKYILNRELQGVPILVFHVDAPMNNEVHPKAAAIASPTPSLDELASAIAAKIKPAPQTSTPESTGNLRERAFALSDEIMEMMYRNGWRLLPDQPTPMGVTRMPNDLAGNQKWIADRSRYFRSVYLQKVISIRNELAQFHLQEDRMDGDISSILDYQDQQINPMSIEDIANGLKRLASQLKNQ